MTLFPPLKSTYGFLAFVGGFFFCLLVWLICTIVGVVLQYTRKPTKPVRIIVIVLHAVAITFFLFGFSVMQSFQVAPFPVTFIVGLVATFPSAAILALLSIPRTALTLFRRGFVLYQSAESKKSVDDEHPLTNESAGSDEPYEVGKPAAPTRSAGPSDDPVVVESVASADLKPAASTSTPNNREQFSSEDGVTPPSTEERKAPADGRMEEEVSQEDQQEPEGGCYCGPVSGKRPAISVHVGLVQENRVRFVLIFLAFMLVNFIFHITMFGGCACVQPVEWTTWAGRASQEKWCEADSPCWAYHLVGQSCTSLNSVVHWMGKTKPTDVTIKVCKGVLTIDGASNCTEDAGIAHRTDIHEHLPVPGDHRFLLHVSTTGLSGDELYTFFYTLSSHTVARVVRTLPCGGSKPITFIGGGDYHATIGEGLLKQANDRANKTAYFLYIGGDLSYSNNMRFCFRRADKFLAQTTAVKREDGGYLPLLTAVGNHEGGGYGHFTTKAERKDGFFFHPQYFPSFADEGITASSPLYQDDDFTATYHRHIIGSTGWIVLDTGIIFTIDEQMAWFNATIKKYSALIDKAELTKIIVTYHNPAFPTVRKLSEKHTKPVRDKIVPVMDSHWPKIPWVLENHDHAYKRTFPLLHGKKVERSSENVKGNGIVYSGDGSLGVADFTRVAEHRWYHAKSSKGNYAIVATLLGTTDADGRVSKVEALDEDGKIFDSFYV